MHPVAQNFVTIN